MIRITSKQHLFRRCGIAHPKETVEYPDDRFTEEQLKHLQAEPRLIVEIVEDEKKEQKTTDPEKMTVAELQTELALYQDFVPSGLKKTEYVEMVSAHREAKGS